MAREDVLDAAFRTLVRQGPTFSVLDVAREAGASKTLIFHHFGAREGLLDAMATRVLAGTQEGLDHLADEYPNPRDRLAAFARTLLEHPRRAGAAPAETRNVLLFWLTADGQGRPRAELRDGLLADFIEALIDEGIATGAIRTSADSAAVVRLLLSRWYGATAVYGAGHEFDFDAEAERLAAEAVALVAP